MSSKSVQCPSYSRLHFILIHRLFLNALQLAGVRSGEACHIGDDYVRRAFVESFSVIGVFSKELDYVAAKKVGMKALLLIREVCQYISLTQCFAMLIHSHRRSEVRLKMPSSSEI